MFSLENFEILQSIDLPDIFEEILWEADHITIRYFDGEIQI